MVGTISLSLEPRTLLGKKVRRLRREGIIPVHFYGKGIESQSLQCESRTLIRVLAQAGMNTPISVSVEGQDGQQLAFVREIQWDPVRGELVHVDFLHVDVSQEVTASVPITTTGQSPAERLVNGTVVLHLREVEIRALPLDMPSEFVANLSAIEQPDDVIRLRDLNLPTNVTIITDLEATVARLELSREEPAAVTTEDLGEEGEAPTEDGTSEEAST